MADDFSGKTGVDGETRAMKGERGRLTASTPITGDTPERDPVDVYLAFKRAELRGETRIMSAFNPAPVLDPSSSQLLIALTYLEAAEANYRKIHDLAGDGNIRTGRAWDHMRRCGDHARMVLAQYRSAALVEKKEEE